MTNQTYDPLSAIERQRGQAEGHIDRITRAIDPLEEQLALLKDDLAEQRNIIDCIDKFYEEHGQIAEDAEKWRKQNASDGKR